MPKKHLSILTLQSERRPNTIQNRRRQLHIFWLVIVFNCKWRGDGPWFAISISCAISSISGWPCTAIRTRTNTYCTIRSIFKARLVHHRIVSVWLSMWISVAASNLVLCLLWPLVHCRLIARKGWPYHTRPLGSVWKTNALSRDHLSKMSRFIGNKQWLREIRYLCRVRCGEMRSRI